MSAGTEARTDLFQRIDFAVAQPFVLSGGRYRLHPGPTPQKPSTLGARACLSKQVGHRFYSSGGR